MLIRYIRIHNNWFLKAAKEKTSVIYATVFMSWECPGRRAGNFDEIIGGFLRYFAKKISLTKNWVEFSVILDVFDKYEPSGLF